MLLLSQVIGACFYAKIYCLFSLQKDKIKPIHLVDVPGHSRLRPILDDFLAQVAGIIFVVDAVEFLPKCRATAE